VETSRFSTISFDMGFLMKASMPIPHMRCKRWFSAMDAMTTTRTSALGLVFLLRMARSKFRLSIPVKLPSVRTISAGNDSRTFSASSPSATVRIPAGATPSNSSRNTSRMRSSS